MLRQWHWLWRLDWFFGGLTFHKLQLVTVKVGKPNSNPIFADRFYTHGITGSAFAVFDHHGAHITDLRTPTLTLSAFERARCFRESDNSHYIVNMDGQFHLSSTDRLSSAASR